MRGFALFLSFLTVLPAWSAVWAQSPVIDLYNADTQEHLATLQDGATYELGIDPFNPVAVAFVVQSSFGADDAHFVLSGPSAALIRQDKTGRFALPEELGAPGARSFVPAVDTTYSLSTRLRRHVSSDQIETIAQSQIFLVTKTVATPELQGAPAPISSLRVYDWSSRRSLGGASHGGAVAFRVDPLNRKGIAVQALTAYGLERLEVYLDDQPFTATQQTPYMIPTAFTGAPWVPAVGERVLTLVPFVRVGDGVVRKGLPLRASLIFFDPNAQPPDSPDDQGGGDDGGSSDGGDGSTGGDDTAGDEDLPPETPSNGGPTPDYYYCDCAAGAAPGCTPGSDSASGKSPGEARRSPQSLMTFLNKMPGNTTVGLCRGGAFDFTKTFDWRNAACKRGKRCTLRDYGSGEQPVINSTGATGAMRLSQGAGYTVMNLNLRVPKGFTLSGKSGDHRWPDRGVLILPPVADVTLDNIVADGFRVGVYMGGGASKDGLSVAVPRFVLRNSRIINNHVQGILGFSSSGTIEGNYLSTNGHGASDLGDGKFNKGHNLYLSGNLRPNKRAWIKVLNNTSVRNSPTGGRGCSSVAVVVHGYLPNVTIAGNTITEKKGTVAEFCSGIAADGSNGAKYPEGFPGLVIRGNRIENVGNRAIGCTSCSNAVIEENVIVNGFPLSFIGIHVPNKSRAPIDDPTVNVTVRNNSVTNDGQGTDVLVKEERGGGR